MGTLSSFSPGVTPPLAGTWVGFRKWASGWGWGLWLCISFVWPKAGLDFCGFRPILGRFWVNVSVLPPRGVWAQEFCPRDSPQRVTNDSRGVTSSFKSFRCLASGHQYLARTPSNAPAHNPAQSCDSEGVFIGNFLQRVLFTRDGALENRAPAFFQTVLCFFFYL